MAIAPREHDMSSPVHRQRDALPWACRHERSTTGLIRRSGPTARAASRRHAAYAEAALAAAKREGLLLAVRARWVALAVIGVVSPIVFPEWEVLYYEAILVLFALIGWAQLQVGEVGRSRRELLLIFCDLALMTFILVVPNPVAGSGLAGGDAIPSRQFPVLLRAARGRDDGLLLAHVFAFGVLDHGPLLRRPSCGRGFSRSIRR